MKPPVEERDRQAFLSVATTIADRICREARWSEQQCTWEVPVAEGRQVVYREADAFLYQGATGIALFLLRLHRVVAEQTYLTTAQGALAHAVASEKRASTASAGYFVGTAGVASACAEFAGVTGEDVWREEALSLCNRIEMTLVKSSMTINDKLDLLAGEAGSLLGLLEVYQATGNTRALRTACHLGDVLVARARREPDGVSWDTQRPAVFRNLLGLSHGAGGVGLALLELYRYTGEPRYFFCATEALRYEDSFCHEPRSSWPDMRCKDVAEHLVDGKMAELRKSVAAGTFDCGEPGAMEAWCHGAPGIGLVRARFLAVTGFDCYRASLVRAAEVTMSSLEGRGMSNYSLCHGVCGNAEILDQLSPHLESREDRARAVVLAAARYGLEHVHFRVERWHTGFTDGKVSSSLMVGEAGVGLFYLRLAIPEVPSVLLPGPRLSADSTLHVSEDLLVEAAEWWCSLHFPRTISALHSAGADPLPTASLTSESVLQGLGQRVKALPSGSETRVRDVLALESAVFELLCERPDFVRSFIRALMRRRVEVLEEPGTHVIMASSSRLCETVYDWETLNLEAPELSSVARRVTTYLIHEVHESYEVRRLSGLVAEMYSLLQEPIGVSTLLDRLLEHLAAQRLLNSPAGADAEAVRRQLMEKLRQAYAAHEIEIVESCDLTPQDIDSAICTRCGECCRITISIPGDAAYAEFLREILEEPLRAHYPEIEIYHQDDEDTPHVIVNLGDCRHLRRLVTESGPKITCDIYERRPAVCAGFNCIAWWREQRSVATRRTKADRVIDKVVRLRAEST